MVSEPFDHPALAVFGKLGDAQAECVGARFALEAVARRPRPFETTELSTPEDVGMPLAPQVLPQSLPLVVGKRVGGYAVHDQGGDGDVQSSKAVVKLDGLRYGHGLRQRDQHCMGLFRVGHGSDALPQGLTYEPSRDHLQDRPRQGDEGQRMTGGGEIHDDVVVVVVPQQGDELEERPHLRKCRCRHEKAAKRGASHGGIDHNADPQCCLQKEAMPRRRREAHAGQAGLELARDGVMKARVTQTRHQRRCRAYVVRDFGDQNAASGGLSLAGEGGADSRLPYAPLTRHQHEPLVPQRQVLHRRSIACRKVDVHVGFTFAPRSLQMSEMSRPLEVLFEDDAYVVVDKPAGIPVHGGSQTKLKTVLERMDTRLSLVHRLDADTSGALVLGKNADAVRRAAAAWPQATKIYWAIAVGDLAGPVRIDDPLSDGRGRLLSAQTEVWPVARTPDRSVTVVGVRLTTGRTHQIRRHLSGLGHPLVMDSRHGDFGFNKEFRQRVRAAGATNPKHTLLHARRVEWLGRCAVAPLPDRWWTWLSVVDIGIGELSDDHASPRDFDERR